MARPRISIVQFRPEKGRYAENIQNIGRILRQVSAWDDPPDILVFPESATSGYFLEGGVGECAVSAETLFEDLRFQHEAAGAPAMDVVIGFYEVFNNHHHNSSMYASFGGAGAGIVHIHRKIFLPTYGVFDERRFVQPGHEVRAFETRFGPCAMLVCEDLWHSITPTLAALDGATMLFVPVASPARGLVPAGVQNGRPEDDPIPASLERWERLARTVAGEHGLYVVLAQLVGFEGGKGFPGVSMVADPNGDAVVRGPLFEEAVLSVQIDTDAIRRARTEQPLLSELRAEFANLIEPPLENRSGEPVYGQGAQSVADAQREPSDLRVVKPRSVPDPLSVDPMIVESWLVAFLKEEVVTRRSFAKGIVGLSGGVDSAVTAYLAVRALGSANVIGVRMPYETSSPESLAHAHLVADELGIQMETVDITQAVDGYVKASPKKLDPTRMGNVMARIRMTTLFDLSAAYNALPLGTGNKSERLLGYFTWHADDSPPVNPIGDLFKTQVWSLAKHLGIPEEIVLKPATADLIENQTDEGDLGISYSKADKILHALLSGFTEAEMADLSLGQEEIELVRKRLDATHWKRRLPTVAMVSQTAIGEYYLRPVDY